MNPLAHILEHKVVAIVRGADPGDLVRIAQALHAGGVRMMEVTLNSPGALASIEEVAGAMAGQHAGGRRHRARPRNGPRRPAGRG